MLTREERRGRNNGDADYFDARRKGHVPGEKIELDREGLRTRLGDLLAEINQLAARGSTLPRQWEVAYRLNRLMESSRALLTAP